MLTEPTPGESLLACHGFEVVGRDGVVGEVETPILSVGSALPDFLVLRVVRPGRLFPDFVVAGVDLVERVDPVRRRVVLDLSVADVDRLPSRLPATEAALGALHR